MGKNLHLRLSGMKVVPDMIVYTAQGKRARVDYVEAPTPDNSEGYVGLQLDGLSRVDRCFPHIIDAEWRESYNSWPGPVTPRN